MASYFLVFKILGALNQIGGSMRGMVLAAAHTLLFWAIPSAVPQAVRDVEQGADADVGEGEEVEGGSGGGEEGEMKEEEAKPKPSAPSLNDVD